MNRGCETSAPAGGSTGPGRAVSVSIVNRRARFLADKKFHQAALYCRLCFAGLALACRFFDSERSYFKPRTKLSGVMRLLSPFFRTPHLVKINFRRR
jgi:hypothetical protein